MTKVLHMAEVKRSIKERELLEADGIVLSDDNYDDQDDQDDDLEALLSSSDNEEQPQKMTKEAKKQFKQI